MMEESAIASELGFEPLIHHNELNDLVNSVAASIASDSKGQKDIHFLTVMEGAKPFSADLAARLKSEHGFKVLQDYITVKSYEGTESNGKPRIITPNLFLVAHRDIILIEDIVDTGQTVDFLMSYLKRERASSIKVATLLSKPSRRKVDVKIDYCGREIPDHFVIGYGLDLDGKFRGLPDIYKKR